MPSVSYMTLNCLNASLIIERNRASCPREIIVLYVLLAGIECSLNPAVAEADLAKYLKEIPNVFRVFFIAERIACMFIASGFILKTR